MESGDDQRGGKDEARADLDARGKLMSGHTTMRVFFAFILFGLTGCLDNSHVDSTRLNTEAESANIDGLPLQGFTLYLFDSKKDLVDVRPLPKTAYIWNESTSHRVDLKGMWFNGQGGYTPNLGRVKRIGFDFVAEGEKPGHPETYPPLDAGLYNISIQFNGSAGIYTVCGSFRVVRGQKMITSKQLNDLH